MAPLCTDVSTKFPSTMETVKTEEDDMANVPTTDTPPGKSILRRLSFLDRFLAVWIFLAMVLGILLGCFVEHVQDVLQTATFVGVSVPIGITHRSTLPGANMLAVGLIVMMYPILCKVRFEELNLVFKDTKLWKQLGFSFVVNWIIAPLVMVCISLLT